MAAWGPCGGWGVGPWKVVQCGRGGMEGGACAAGGRRRSTSAAFTSQKEKGRRREDKRVLKGTTNGSGEPVHATSSNPHMQCEIFPV